MGFDAATQAEIDGLVERRLTRERRLLNERHAHELADLNAAHAAEIARLVSARRKRSLIQTVRDWFTRTTKE